MTKRRVVVATEYGGDDYLWSGGPYSMDFAVSSELDLAFRRWAREWGTGPPPPANDPTYADYQRWLQRGKDLCERLQAEVGDDWEVVYRPTDEDWRTDAG